ncbi:MAG: hypothetical protein IJD43_05000 [Thermoguttaceae bacterium]|nr:hypothetical protein [Thermoguttaceae bacterium]
MKKLKGIVMSDHSVCKILDGTKTQTRRKIGIRHYVGQELYVKQAFANVSVGENSFPILRALGFNDYLRLFRPIDGHYEANIDGELVSVNREQIQNQYLKIRWKQSRFMKADYARIHLLITKISYQKLGAISEDDAKAEGAEPIEGSYIQGFRDLWERVNGKGTWDPGRDVEVIQFEVLRNNSKTSEWNLDL